MPVWREIKAVLRDSPFPFGVSVIALALAIGQGWEVLWTHRLISYDASTAVLTATLITLVWTANYSFHAVRDARIREAGARSSLLAGVAAECDSIDSSLEMINERLYHVRVLHIERPMFAEALRNTHLLNELEVGILTKLSTSLSLIDDAVEDLIARASRVSDNYLSLSPSELEQRLPDSVDGLRALIAGARERLPETAKSLSPTIYALTKWGVKD